MQADFQAFLHLEKDGRASRRSVRNVSVQAESYFSFGKRVDGVCKLQQWDTVVRAPSRGRTGTSAMARQQATATSWVQKSETRRTRTFTIRVRAEDAASNTLVS